MTASNDLLGQLAESAPRHLEELIEWLRIPSVSSDSTRVTEVKQAATWVADKLEQAGLFVEILPTQGHPMFTRSRQKLRVLPLFWFMDTMTFSQLNRWMSGSTDRLSRLFVMGMCTLVCHR